MSSCPEQPCSHLTHLVSCRKVEAVIGFGPKWIRFGVVLQTFPVQSRPKQLAFEYMHVYADGMQRMLSTNEVAERAGVHKLTLIRWMKQGIVAEPSRDWRGWRHFSDEQANEIEAFAKGQTEPSSGSDDAISKLLGIDWTFSDAKTNYLTHGLHPYPAKFIPQIPNALIQELSSVGDTVADIFCGSGTTLLEALTLKRNAIGIDANPLSALISRAKTATDP